MRKGPSFALKVDKEIATRKAMIKTSDSFCLYVREGTKAYDFYKMMLSIHNVPDPIHVWHTSRILCYYLYKEHLLYEDVKADIHFNLRDVKVLGTKHKWAEAFISLWNHE